MNTPHKKSKEDEIITDTAHSICLLEMKRIKKAIERSDTEKFLLFTRMMRIHFMLQNAVIIKKIVEFFLRFVKLNLSTGNILSQGLSCQVHLNS